MIILNAILVISPLISHWPEEIPMQYRIVNKPCYYAAKQIRSTMKSESVQESPCAVITVHMAGIGNTPFLLYPEAAGVVYLVVDGSKSPAKILSADLAINRKVRKKFIGGIVSEQIQILRSPVIAVGKDAPKGWLWDGTRIINGQ